MKIVAKITEIGPIESYTNRDGQDKTKQTVKMETDNAYPDEIVATIWNKTAQQLGLKTGITATVKLAFSIREFTDKNGKQRKSQEVSLWDAE